MKTWVFGVGGMFMLAATHAAADPVEQGVTYSVFDLKADAIPILSFSEGQDVASEPEFISGVTPGVCGTKTFESKLDNKVRRTLNVTPDGAKTCPMFSAREPGKFVLELKVKGGLAQRISAEPRSYATYSGPVTYDGAYVHLPGFKLGDGVETICAAFYSTRDTHWRTQKGTVSSAEVSFPLETGDATGVVYLRYGACPNPADPQVPAAILRVTFPQLAMRDIADTSFCGEGPQFKGAYLPDGHSGESYKICVDQANAQGQARIVENKDHYISTFTWGRLAIRHWPNVIPALTINGAAVSIRQAPLAGTTLDASPTTGTVSAPASTTGFVLPPGLDGQGVSTSPVKPDGSVVSEVFIPPHAPGALHLDLRFLDPNDAKPKAATAIDLSVDQGYAGAIRVGIARILFSPEHSFKTLQRFKDGPIEITETSGAPTEVIVGYSYFLCTGPAGRGYAFHHGWTQRFGALLAFGAASYTPGQPLDFLRSIHFGPEYEISRHITVTATVVVRRQSALHDFKVGGPAPEGDLPLETNYDWGIGLGLAFSPDFLKVASGGAK